MLNPFLKFAALVAFLGAAAACNTVEGVGRDVEAGGEALTGAADNVEEDID